METDLELFVWHRPEVGAYKWVNGQIAFPGEPDDSDLGAERRFLDVKRDGSEKFVYYQPLTDTPRLFREFVSVPATEDGFLSFANKFGNLGIGVPIFRDDSVRDGKRVSHLTMHDPLHRWYEAHHKMREIVDVLSAIQDRNLGVLREWINIADGGIRYHRNDDWGQHWAWVTIAKQRRAYLWDWATSADSEDETILRGAIGFAQGEINSAVSNSSGLASTMRVVFDADKRQMSMRVCPSNLLGAMWLQIARALTENPPLKQCEYCDRWFELSSEAKRGITRFCSAKCKVAWHRKYPKDAT
jgi:hypothetical protein